MRKFVLLFIVCVIHKGNSMERYEATALHLACARGDIEQVKQELTSDDRRVYALGSIEKEIGTPLYFACKYGYKDIVEILIHHKYAFIDPLPINKEQTPLCVAPTREIAQLLIKCIPFRCDEALSFPFLTHIKNHNFEVAQVFLAKGARVHPMKILKQYPNLLNQPSFFNLFNEWNMYTKLCIFFSDQPEENPATLLDKSAYYLKQLHEKAQDSEETKTKYRRALKSIQRLFDHAEKNYLRIPIPSRASDFPNKPRILLMDNKLITYKVFYDDFYDVFCAEAISYANKALSEAKLCGI